ncbi:MAG TPA: tetratricopeptide repeat-containing protein, partial [Planctomycetes bacterium]|nr:tetratricopeptide repeat-containing protein [Planctomycetota bacterium]
MSVQEPRETNAALRRGIAAARAGELEAALDHYAEALALDPGHLAARANRASALLHLGRCEEAVEECDT